MYENDRNRTGKSTRYYRRNLHGGGRGDFDCDVRQFSAYVHAGYFAGGRRHESFAGYRSDAVAAGCSQDAGA